MWDISKYSLLGVLSIIFAINALNYALIQIILIVILKNCIFLEGLFIVLTFLNIITTILGLIAWFIIKDNMGKTATLIGVIGFYLNLIGFLLCRMDFYFG